MCGLLSAPLVRALCNQETHVLLVWSCKFRSMGMSTCRCLCMLNQLAVYLSHVAVAALTARTAAHTGTTQYLTLQEDMECMNK